MFHQADAPGQLQDLLEELYSAVTKYLPPSLFPLFFSYSQHLIVSGLQTDLE